MGVDATDDFLTLAEEGARGRLRGSVLAGLAPREKVADLFCGAGGWGEGARELGIEVDFAVNHDPVAIAAHIANNPRCKHHQGDAWRTKPRAVIGSAKLGLLLASAACTSHSRARGSAPISKRVHMLGWCIARWMEDVAPRIVLVENVAEWLGWGPTILNAEGLRVQDPARKGQHFRRWWRYCERLGYVMERRVLDAPDYGAASRRKRLFVIARRDGHPIVWPEVTHGKADYDAETADFARALSTSSPVQSSAAVGHRKGGLSKCTNRDTHSVGRSVRAYRTAAECIDWNDLGSSIVERKKPLKDKTLARIAEGVRRFVLTRADPFVLRVTHGERAGSWYVSAVDQVAPTQTTRQDLAVCSPIVTPAGGPKRQPSAADAVLPTCLVREALAVATPILQVIRGDATGRDVREPLPTITAGNGPGRGAGAAHAMGIATPLLAVCAHGDKASGVKRWGRPGLCAFALDGEPAARAREVTAFLVKYLGQAVPVCGTCGMAYVVIDGVRRYFIDLLFRMVKPSELAKAMGFRADYVWPKTQRESVRLIGNAVAPPMARALVASVLPRGRLRGSVLAGRQAGGVKRAGVAT